MSTYPSLHERSACLMNLYRQPDWLCERGQGVWLWDDAGHQYLDFTSGIGVNALGHAHPEVVAAVSEQAGRLLHTSNMFRHLPHLELGEWLVKHSFGTRVMLTNSGTEATEAAMKLAARHFYNQGELRNHFVSAHGGFHGRSLGALSITAQASYRLGFEHLLIDSTQVPFGDLQAVEASIKPSTAAVVLEPIQGNAGVVLPPADYFKGLRSICDSHGCLLIIDEIQTGIGRTGRWFGYEHEGVVADMMTSAKALGGGLPLGALVTGENLAAAFEVGSHGTTFGGNPVACAAGLATLRIIERDNLLQNAESLGNLALESLTRLGQQHACIRAVRGRGLMLGVELECEAPKAVRACREVGLLVTAGGSHALRILPPLSVDQQTLELGWHRLGQALQNCCSHG